MLVSSGKYTFLPELYDILGREATIKFLDVFAGCRISVPKIERLEKLARNASIYVRLEAASPQRDHIVTENLASEYDLTPDRVRRIYASTKVHLEDELGFKVIRGASREKK